MTGIPGARAVHHVACTVPDLDEAVDFFVRVIGGEEVYRLDSVSAPADDPGWMARKLGVPADAFARIAMLRLGPVTNLELFEYRAPGQHRVLPRNSDWGGHHLAIYVDDVDTAVEYLRAFPGVTVLGEPETIVDGPIAGDRWVYFTTPWGMQLELIHLPHGRPYESRTGARVFTPRRPWRNR
ncbi:MAG TPA: VOC family protein [Amycolatopsis sp.]|jgi:catechol 2,3-dioxygenase-like lactoylglutathione lyase family enzyme|nr:VOC family protein [Amycolatopsis sp.]